MFRVRKVRVVIDSSTVVGLWVVNFISASHDSSVGVVTGATGWTTRGDAVRFPWEATDLYVFKQFIPLCF